MSEKSLLESINKKYGSLTADQIKDMIEQDLDPTDSAHRANYLKMHQFVNPNLPESQQQFHKHTTAPLKYVPHDNEK